MTYLKTAFAAALALISLAPSARAQAMDITCAPDPTASGASAPCATEFYAMLPVAEEYAAQDIVLTSAPDPCHRVTLVFSLPGRTFLTIENLAPGDTQRFSFTKLQPLGGEWDETIPETEFQSSPFYPEVMVKATSDASACATDAPTGWTVTLDLLPAAP